MILGEPTPTPADLHFRIFGFPVRVHPYFWLVSMIMGAGGFGGSQVDPKDVFVWVGVVFVSILVHELGHATMQRFYGGRPWITLYAMGGLASCNDGPRSPGKRILILLAGPGAGFLLATITLVALKASGHSFGFARSGDDIDLEELGSMRVLIQPLGPFVAYFEPLRSDSLNNVIGDLLQVNILWGLVNLLPIYPLDGGQISRELFNLANPRYGATQSLQLSAGAATLVAAYAILNKDYYLAAMFGYLAYSSFQSLQFYRDRW